MSTILELDVNPELAAGTCCNHKSRELKSKHRKSKENHFKPRYSKELKNKLKKYKLRRDGQEDQEVLDVSKILVTSLKIKSPNNNYENNINDDENLHELRPKNYLFKMGRRKILTKTGSNNIISKESEGSREVEGTTKKVEEARADCKALNKKCEAINAPAVNNIEDEPVINGKDKRHTNAFKLMMDSRNKSIGSNSPGKEVVSDCEIQDTNEKKVLKAKRTLMLEKMAEMKGSLKKKEMEEYQDNLIKKKMDKRAERLKKMIANREKYSIKDSENSKPENDVVTTKYPNKTNDNIVLPNQNNKIIDLFHDSNKNAYNPISSKKISKEDKEFLKKLSPSLKKKENMLSYFKKIQKESDDISDIGNGDVDENIESAVLKVKLTPKAKKKIKEKKLSLSNDLKNNLDSNDHRKIENELVSREHKKKPIKENNNKCQENMKLINTIDSVETSMKDSTRPRRNVKRPAKYIDVLQLSSSDDELHIFTPKKKKQVDPKESSGNKISKNEDKSKVCDNSYKEKIMKAKVIKPDLKTNKKVIKDDTIQKKVAKLAPIFKIKPILDTAAMEAKQRFLNSGVPDTLKKLKEKQDNRKVGLNYFHSVVHVQQTDPAILTTNNLTFNFKDNNVDEYDITIAKESFKKLLIIENLRPSLKNVDQLATNNKTQVLLQNIKEINPKFPVYRTFRLLKDKSKGECNNGSMIDLDNSVEIINNFTDTNNESPDILNWTDKYKPMASKQIIGNFYTIKELKKWLISWTENDIKRNRYNGESDSSDFYCSDTDSKDSIKISNNLLILTGPVGSGKTSMVYAVASELAFKVLEVNASSKRTGKIMLQDLQEATQSHKVNRGKSSSQDCSQKIQEVIEVEVVTKSKTRGRPKKELRFKKTKNVNCSEELCPSQSSQGSTRTCMSLILIDDADIVFDQDDGFCSAIVQLVQTSKRPVILIASSSTCPHLQRFLNSGKLMHTRPFLPSMLGIWLDIMCLAETNTCWPGLGARFLEYYNGDIRKAINSLQFYLTKEPSNEEDIASQNSDYHQMNVEDENSNMCWSDNECADEKIEMYTNFKKLDIVWQHLMTDQINLVHYSYPMKLCNIWWNLPELLGTLFSNTKENIKSPKKDKKVNTKLSDLESIANVYDMVSVSDYLRSRNIENNTYYLNDPWLCVESDSVSEQENLDNYNKCNEIMDDICHRLVSGTIVDVQKKLGLDNKTELNFPYTVLKRERNRIIARHNNLTKYLNPSAVLDRRALALDYWSTGRTICRTEKAKTDSNSKRNNRFCHYLKSINVLCNNDSLDYLCNSLSISKEK